MSEFVPGQEVIHTVKEIHAYKWRKGDMRVTRNEFEAVVVAKTEKAYRVRFKNGVIKVCRPDSLRAKK